MVSKEEHCEAFQMMLYQCENCTATEEIWNGWNGESPKYVKCLFCEGKAFSVPGKNVYSPYHIPEIGSRIFLEHKEYKQMPVVTLVTKEVREFIEKKLPEKKKNIAENFEEAIAKSREKPKYSEAMEKVVKELANDNLPVCAFNYVLKGVGDYPAEGWLAENGYLYVRVRRPGPLAVIVTLEKKSIAHWIEFGPAGGGGVIFDPTLGNPT